MGTIFSKGPDRTNQKRERTSKGGMNKMISDILFDARTDIEEYLKDEKNKEFYNSLDIFFDIKETLHRMEMLQLKLDRANK